MTSYCWQVWMVIHEFTINNNKNITVEVTKLFWIKYARTISAVTSFEGDPLGYLSIRLETVHNVCK